MKGISDEKLFASVPDHCRNGCEVRIAYGLLVLYSVFSLVACSNTAATDNYHVVYRYQLPTVNRADYTPGSTITLTWQAVPTEDHTASAYPIVLKSSLTKDKSANNGVLDSSTITTTNWDGRNYTTTIHIGKNVPFGNYYLTQSSTVKAVHAVETTKAGGTYITIRS